MAESEGSGELSPLGDTVASIERWLGLSANIEPAWGYLETIDQLFPEEAPTVEGRVFANQCLTEIIALVDISEKLPELRRDPVTVEQLQETVDDYLTWAKEQREGLEPFPTITLEHLLGAVKRQIALLRQLRDFEETEHFNGALGVCRSVRALIERAIWERANEEPE
jgi:hypothetical protein